MQDPYICPHCQKPIYDEDALLCHFCGESLNRSSKDVLGKIRYGDSRLWLYLVGAIVLVAFISLLVF